MRLKNKILIEGDTLRIFEEIDTYNGFKIGDFVKIDPNAAQQSGLDPNKSYEIQGFVDYGKGMSKSINAVLDKELYKPHIYPPKGIISVKSITKELNEENTLSPNKLVPGTKYLYTGGAEYMNVTYIGLANNHPELKAGSSMGKGFLFQWPDSKYFELGPLSIKKYIEPEESMNEAINELSTYNNTPITSSYNGKTITWDDYEVEEKNVDGGGYTDAITLMGSDQDGNKYICQGSMTLGDVDEWDDSTIEMVNSINEAKKGKTDPAEKKKAEKTNYGHKDMADVDMVNPYELRKGIRIEMVDTDDYEKAMDKAVKKLKKDPIYYSNLIANSKETKGKRADIPTEIKDKKLNKVSDKLKDKANEMSVSKKDAAKKNANDSLNKKEKASGKPKGVKEMTMKSKSSKGMKSMTVPGKEKKISLKENVNLWEAFKKNILR